MTSFFKKELIKSFFLVCFLFFSISSFAQSGASVVEQARAKAYSKDFAGADQLLTSYTANNNDINALRLHAQVLYWMKDFDRAAQVHRKIQKLYPDVNEVKLDYGRFLYEMGKTGMAENYLEEYVSNDPDHAEANLMLSYIDMWSGRMGKAKKRALRMSNIYPENEEFKSILQTIKETTAPLLSAGGVTYSDDQPVKYSGLQLTGQWYKSWLFSPVVQFRNRGYNSFEQDYNTRWIEMENSIYLKSKTTVNFKGGVFQSNATNDPFYTGGIGLKQGLFGGLSLNFDVEKVPYQYSASSIVEPFTENVYKGFFKLEKKNGLLGEAGFQQEVFPDANVIKAAYVWMLLPLANQPNFKLSGGYSYNYSTSEESTFIVTETTSGGGTGFPPVFSRPTTKIEGYYDLYFTPNNQQVNSLLSYMRIGSDMTNFTMKLNVGIVASADSPNGGSTSSTTFERVSYTPVEFETSLNLGLSKQVTLSGRYNYQSLFFFKNHMADIQLTYRIFK